jgi:tetratricopeptide (TPR) repeat protein
LATIKELYNEAEDLRDAGNYEDAIKKCDEILAIDDSYAMAHLALAHIYSGLGKAEDSVRHGERALALDSDDAQTYRVMSIVYRKAYESTQDMSFIQKAEDAMARANMMD